MLTLEGWQKLDRGARMISPVLVALLLMFVLMVPLRLPNFGTIAPSVALMAVFYWAVYRPDLFGPVAVGILGFVQDALSGAPLGLNAMVFLLAYSSVVSQRQLFLAHGFFILWWGFALTAVIAGFVAWGIQSFLHFSLVPFDPVLYQAAATISLFPPAAWLFGKVQRAFLSGL